MPASRNRQMPPPASPTEGRLVVWQGAPRCVPCVVEFCAQGAALCAHRL